MGTLELLSGLCVLILAATGITWFSPHALEVIEARLHARRDAMRTQRISYHWFLQRFREER